MKLQEKYSLAKEAVANIQRELYGPPSREKIDRAVRYIVKKFDLWHSKVEHYFVLWATCALLGKEPMCSHWKYRPRYKARAAALVRKIREQEKRNG